MGTSLGGSTEQASAGHAAARQWKREHVDGSKPAYTVKISQKYHSSGMAKISGRVCCARRYAGLSLKERIKFSTLRPQSASASP